MKNLFLIRHAKSDWSAGLPDRERPLNERGVRSAVGMASLVGHRIPAGAIIWSSPAKRALTTARLFVGEWGRNVKEIEDRDALYTFEEIGLEKAISTCPDHVSDLVVFGHNEALTDLVNSLGDRYIDNVPTAGFVHLELPVESWSQLRKGRTVAALFPKEHDIL